MVSFAFFVSRWRGKDYPSGFNQPEAEGLCYKQGAPPLEKWMSVPFPRRQLGGVLAAAAVGIVSNGKATGETAGSGGRTVLI